MMATMRAAMITAPKTFEVREVRIPMPGPGEALVRLEGCGVCASNLPPWEGREWFSYPMEPGALGHEGWGRVAEVGAGVTSVAPGDRVAMLSNNAYAEYDKAPVESLVTLPRTLEGMPFPGEPLGCAFNIFNRSGIKSGDSVAIVGTGFLGALLSKLASSAGARVIALTRRSSALAIAAEMGASETIPLDDHWRIIERVKSLTDERFCDVVIECTGKEWPLNLAAELTRVRGRLVVAGFHQDGLRSVNMQLWNWRGLDVINAHERDPAAYIEGIRTAVEAVATDRLDPTRLFTHAYSLNELGDALEATGSRPEGFLKALVLTP